MRKEALLLIAILFNLYTLSAQYAVVVDDGGFVNVYDDEKEELDRLGSDGVVAILDEEEEEWIHIDYTKYGEYAASSGYVKKTNLIDITSYTEIPITTDSADFVVLSNGEITIKLSTKPFVEEEHIMTFFSSENKDVITRVDGQEYWGTRVGLPTTEYESITLNQEGETIEFPTEAFFNIFNPHLSLTKAYYDKENDIIYCYSANGDISCPYTALWVMEFGDYAIHYIFD